MFSSFWIWILSWTPYSWFLISVEFLWCSVNPPCCSLHFFRCMGGELTWNYCCTVGDFILAKSRRFQLMKKWNGSLPSEIPWQCFQHHTNHRTSRVSHDSSDQCTCFLANVGMWSINLEGTHWFAFFCIHRGILRPWTHLLSCCPTAVMLDPQVITFCSNPGTTKARALCKHGWPPKNNDTFTIFQWGTWRTII